MTGDRHRTGAEKRMRVGWEFCHSIIDDHSRLAYTELHRDEKAATVTAFLERALEFFADHGIQPARLQTDNAWTYVHNRSLRELLAAHGITTARSRPAPRSATARSSATSRPSRANGPTDSATATQTPAPTRSPSGSTHYNTTRNHSSLSTTGRPSPAFGTSRGTTPEAR